MSNKEMSVGDALKLVRDLCEKVSAVNEQIHVGRSYAFIYDAHEAWDPCAELNGFLLGKLEDCGGIEKVLEVLEQKLRQA